MADTGIMLSTLWAQDGVFVYPGNTTVTYNYYCPIYPDSGRQSVTGCSNTAAAQVLHYYIEKYGLILQLRLTVEDEYISNLNSAAPDIAIKADGSTAGTASFATINNLLANYSVTSPQASAALTYACGVVQEANYTSTTTSTAWNLDLFKRAGFETMTSVFVNDKTKYYWGRKGNISADAFEVIIENLTAGRVVIAGYPGHDVVIDGYNSSTDKFHINFGWGKDAPETRWYSRSEINQGGFEFFLYDLEINGSYKVTVYDNAVYGTGTLLRAVEKAEGTFGDNQIAFSSSASGKLLELSDKIILTDSVTRVSDCNLSILVTDNISSSSQNYLWMGESSNSTYFENYTGDVIINSNRTTQAAFYYYNAKKLSVQTNGALIFAGSYRSGGSYSTGAKNILSSMQSSANSNTELASFVQDAVSGYSFYGTNGDDEFVLANQTIAAGNIQFLSGRDVLRLQNNSRIYGDIVASTGGTQKIIIDNTSSLNGVINAISDVVMDLNGTGNTRAMLTTINSNDVYQKCELTADIFDASAGTFTLVTATGNSYLLGEIYVTVTGGGGQDFILCANGTSENDQARLFVDNNSLKLAVKRKNTTDKTAPVLNRSLTSAVYRDKAEVSWAASSDNVKVQGYQLRYGQSAGLDNAAVVRVDDLKYTFRSLAVGDYYWQIRAFDANGNYSQWSDVQNFQIKEDKADLMIGNFTVSNLKPLTNQSVNLTFSVKNIGTRRSDAVKVGVYAGVTKLGEVSVPQVLAGGEQYCTFTIAAGKLAAGSHNIQLVIDAANKLDESDESNNRKNQFISVTRAAADLYVKSFTVSSASVYTYNSLTLTIQVANAGNIAAAATRLGIYDGTSTKLGEVAVGAIAAGAAATYTYTIAAGKLTAGTHKFYAVSDLGKTLAESNESNNQKNVSATVKSPEGPADLYVKSFTVSAASIYTYEGVKLTVQIANSGKNISSATKIGIYDGPSTKIGEVALAAILPGGTATCTYTIAAGKLTAGTHKFYAVTDLGNAVKESNENNNQKSLSMTVKSPEGPADLYVKSFTVSSASITTANTVTLTIQIANAGKNISSATKIGIYDGPSTKIGEVALAAILPNGTATCTYTIAAGKLTAGTHKIYAVTDMGNVVKESNENNNQKSVSISVVKPAAVADLYVRSFSTSTTSVSAANSVRLTIQIGNSGTADSTATKVGIYDGPSTKIGEVAIAAIPAGGYKTYTFDIPAGRLSVGTHKIYAVSDLGNSVKESNENNNQKSLELAVTKVTAPDICVKSLTTPASVVSTKDSVTLTFQVHNIGDAPAADTKLGIYDGGSRKIGEMSIYSLYAAGYRTYTYTIAAGTLGVGTHKIYTVSDLGNTVKESNENNNQNSISVEVKEIAKQPDLHFKKMVISSTTVSQEKSVELFLTVENLGNVIAKSSKISIYDGSTKLGEVAVNDIYATGYKTYQFSINGSKLTAGTHTITAVIDAAGTLEELNESNNRSSVQLEVTAPTRDLYMNYVKRLAAPAGAVKVAFSFGNSGNTSTQATKASIYVSGNKVGEVAIGEFAPGQYDTYVYTIAAGVLAPGEHNIIVVLDPANTVKETNEDNNRSSVLIDLYDPYFVITNSAAPLCESTPLDLSDWQSESAPSEMLSQALAAEGLNAAGWNSNIAEASLFAGNEENSLDSDIEDKNKYALLA